MTITKIKVFSATNTMGDNVTEDDADGYRAWLADELAREFPGADIEVSDDQTTNTVEIDADIDDYNDAEERAHWFLNAAWDRCPWTWVST